MAQSHCNGLSARSLNLFGLTIPHGLPIPKSHLRMAGTTALKSTELVAAQFKPCFSPDAFPFLPPDQPGKAAVVLHGWESIYLPLYLPITPPSNPSPFLPSHHPTAFPFQPITLPSFPSSPSFRPINTPRFARRWITHCSDFASLEWVWVVI